VFAGRITAVDAANLDFGMDEMRAMADAVVERAVAHIAALDGAPACGNVEAEALCRSLREPAPVAPVELALLLDRLFEEWIPRSFTTPGPGYLAYIPGGGVYPAALADFVANTTNRYTGVWQASPVLVQLEANALEWLRDWMQFPAATRGLFTRGGSMSNFSALVCARERHLGVDVRRGTVYTSTQAHHCVLRAAKLAGIFPDRVRRVGVDSDFRLRVDDLSAAVAADRRAGLTPFAVVSSAGTTNTGAVDPLEAIGDFCAREGLWHHVDGAYGAFFHAVPELRPLLAGLSRADSLTLDPHKGLFLPYGTGALLVRDGEALRAAHGLDEHAPYLPDHPDPAEFYDPSEYGPDLSRDFPGLRVWLTLKLYGTARLEAAIREKRELAVWAAEQVEAVPGIVMVARPQLSLFAFHLRWPGSALDEENAATRDLLRRVTARGRVMITGCTVDGRFLARVCVLCFRTRRDRVEEAVQHIAEETAAILEAGTRASAPLRGRTPQ
jgi:aromatic-L-amino-acid decarboxylase